jgi:succinate dehydrogenase / fumarate reductase, membrane anchor subunit
MAVNRRDRRSPLAIATGLGSAKAGAAQWWAERVTALALVPLTVWFVAAIIAHSGDSYLRFVHWLRSPLTASLMVLLLVSVFYHSALGLRVVIEDYVHSDARFAAVIAIHLGCAALAVIGVVAVFRVAFGV